MLICSSHVQLFAILWTVAHLAPLAMGFSKQKYWSRLPIPSPGGLPDPGMGPGSPALQAGSYRLSRQDYLDILSPTMLHPRRLEVLPCTGR